MAAEIATPDNIPARLELAAEKLYNEWFAARVRDGKSFVPWEHADTYWKKSFRVLAALPVEKVAS